MIHSFQVNGIQVAYFNSGGLAMNSNSVGFLNNGAGITWEQIIAESMMMVTYIAIATDDYLNIFQYQHKYHLHHPIHFSVETCIRIIIY